MKFRTVHLSPPQFLIIVYLILAVAGTFLLKLPIATTKTISWLDTLFTVTSAFTLTGLGVTDTGTTFTLFGELIILLLIQIGGLGYMSFTVLVFIMLGKKIGFRERILLQTALNMTNVGGIIRLAINIFVITFLIETIGAFILAISWVPEFGFAKGIYYGFFHSISAFNNAGFSLFPNNLMNYVGDPIVNLAITSLIILGGIGFSVIVDVYRKRKFSKLALHSKIMIVGTIGFTIFGTLFIFFLEKGQTYFAHLSLQEQFFASFFQAVTHRTAGFNTIDLSQLQDGSILMMMIYMFIGGGSGSTAGGIKLSTFIIILLSVINYCKGKNTISVFRRAIRPELVIKSLAITMVGLSVVFLATLILSITEDATLTVITYEVISAFATVGVTLNFTSELSEIGRFIIIILMFLGKVGALALILSLSKPDKTKIKYPAEDVLSG